MIACQVRTDVTRCYGGAKFCLMEKESGSFLKKRTKKLFFMGCDGPSGVRANGKFSVSFFRKKQALPCSYLLDAR
jgi:hypothetical protein